MNYSYELYFSDEAITDDDWKKLHFTIGHYMGLLGDYRIVILTKDSTLRYFLQTGKDISSIGGNLPSMILRSLSDSSVLTLPHSPSKLSFMQFVTGGNLVDLLEKYSVKKQVQLEYSVFDVTFVSQAKSLVKSRFYFVDANGIHKRATKRFVTFPAHLFSMDFKANSTYLKRDLPKYLNIEKSMSMLTNNAAGALFSVDGFPYFNEQYFLGLHNYEFDKHSLIVGASGSGKSKLIALYIDRLAKAQFKNTYRVAVIDPHASIAEDFAHIADQKVIEFGRENAELFADQNQDVQASVELTTTLFKDLLKDDFNPRLERVLRFSLFVLFTAQSMSLDNLKRLITELDYRNQVLTHIKDYVPANIMQFFAADFNEIKTQHYSQAISPIVNLVEEMQLQPGMTGADGVSLVHAIQNNFLTTFSLNKVSMGDKVVKTVAGLLIQQIFLLAQSRTFNEKVVLIIDEVSVVQSPALAQILSEARKFNLTVVITQQYFSQIDQQLQESIFANIINYYAFKVSEQDARTLEGNMSIELPASVVEAEAKKGVSESELRVRLLTELHTRECLVRVSASGQLKPCVKCRTLDANFASVNDTKQPKLKQLTQQKPDKFVEHAEPQLPQADQAQTPTTPMNVSELLAKNSSSRYLVNQEKTNDPS